MKKKLPCSSICYNRDKPERVLVFVNTRHAADEVSRTLSANEISNSALSGDVPQPKRESILERFKSGKYNVLVATDVAARGLHIPEVSHVFNYDLPQDADDYIHRIGRTARAGHSGEAISFICERYAYSIMEIESFIGHAIPRKEIEPALLMPIEKIATARPYQGKSPVNTPKLNDDKNRLGGSADSPPIAKKPDPDSVAQPQPKQPMLDDKISAIETPPKASLQPERKTPMPALPKTHFSRRFGEIPLVG